MKALQIINNSDVEVVKHYWTTKQYMISLKSDMAIHVFYVNFDNDGNYSISFAENFSSEYLKITFPLSKLIEFKEIEVNSCDDMQIKFPDVNFKNTDTSIESFVNSAKAEVLTDNDSDYQGFSYEQYEGVNSL